MKKIADSLVPSIQFTTDYPTNNLSGMVPCLDVQMYSDGKKIWYTFYEKPMTCKSVIPSSSAHSKRMKISVMIEEGVRRLRNNSRNIGWEVRRVVMEDWSYKLRRSGYGQTFRHQVVKAACEKWEGMCRDEDEGKRPIHRTREWNEELRRKNKEKTKLSWHNRGEVGVSAPLILHPTGGDLNEKLRKLCGEHEKSFNMRLAVVERAGDPIARDAKSEPLREIGCKREECFPCRGERGGNCERNGIGYRIRCKTCEEVDGLRTLYEGETGRNGYSRGKEHLAGLENKNEDNPLWKHSRIQHNGVEPEFEMKILSQHKYCL